jgi:hypothetical protein
MHQLNLNRLMLFIKRQAIINIHSFWITIGAISGFVLIVSLYANYASSGSVNLSWFYMVVFFIAGLIFTSKFFEELHKPQKSYALLTLPVSNLEKLVGSWIITAPGFIILYLIFVSLIVSVSALVAGNIPDLSQIFNTETFELLTVFMIVQPIFLLGSTTFKGNNFLKTILSVFVIVVASSMVLSSMLSMLFDVTSNESGSFTPVLFDFANETFLKIVKILFYYFLGPFMLLVSYFKLKERQV